MAKKISTQSLIQRPSDLVTLREKTRAGFIALALEKNYLATPYIEEAKALKILAGKAEKPIDLLEMEDLRMGLLSASGLSEKSLKFLDEDDKTLAIKGLIEEFLEPADDRFVEELVYRYLLTKGDALGGKARNLAGTLGERKFMRAFLSVLKLSGIDFRWKDSDSNAWLEKPEDDTDIENRLKGIAWSNSTGNRVMILNITVPIVKKNVDLNILNGTISDLEGGVDSIIYESNAYVALGELKGGIDPAGADEHWKTANSALNRIRTGFEKQQHHPKIFFIGAAIENSMAKEIFRQLQNGTLHQAANLTDEKQLVEMCKWILEL